MLLRDELQRRADGQGKRLTFPRFDLGAIIAKDPSTDKDLSALTRDDVQGKLSGGKQVFESFAAVGSTLGFLVPYLPALIAGVRLAGKAVEQIPVVQDILGHLEDSTDWKWYHTKLGLDAKAGMKEVLLHLYELSRPGHRDREQQVINEWLPAAFAADLYGALVETTPPKAWSNTANVVIFLDGFEDLQSVSSTTATQLLQGLTAKPRKNGQTDPLLLVIGGRVPLTGMTEDAPLVPNVRTQHKDEATVKQRIRDLYTQWQQRPKPLEYLRPEVNLVLPLQLRDFGLEHTRNYLLAVGNQKQKAVFAADPLVQAIAKLTHGHPLFLALAAEAVLEAEARGHPLKPTAFQLQRAKVSREIAPEHAVEAIGEYLLDLFLKQLPAAERKDLIFCAVPRVLDEAILREVLPDLDDIAAPKRWRDIQQRSFVSAMDEQRIVVHTVLRGLLLRQLPVSVVPKSNFVRIHAQLQDHFQKRASHGDIRAAAEAAYHALALGDPEPAIYLGIAAQDPFGTWGPPLRSFPFIRRLLGSATDRSPLWDTLVEAVSQAPTELMPRHIRQQADMALALPQYEMHEKVKAIVLYTWLLSAPRGAPDDRARLQNNLREAYSSLALVGELHKEAIACYEATLQVYTREAFPIDWARTQYNLGDVYMWLIADDRHYDHAITCYEAALQVHTRESFPIQWAEVQYRLGDAYSLRLGGDHETNLRQAITCYEAALQVFSVMYLDDDDYFPAVTWSLEDAKGELQKLTQPEQLPPTQQPQQPGQEIS